MKNIPSHPRRLRRQRAGSALLGTLLLSAAVQSAIPTSTTHAATAASLAVTTTADGVPGSLRSAISAANADAAPDEISLGDGTYVLDIVGVDNVNAVGDLDILQPLTIRGAGMDQTIIAANQIGERVLDVILAGKLTLIGVTVRGGLEDDLGGGVRVLTNQVLTLQDTAFRNNQAVLGGGAIYSEAPLAITDSVFSGNEALGPTSKGGAIQFVVPTNDGVGKITSTEFSNNNGHNSGGAIAGSGMFLEIENSTISGNTANTGPALWNEGGAILTRTWLLDHVTLADNTATVYSASVHSEGNALFTLQDSIVLSDAQGCNFLPNASGVNLVLGYTCGFDPDHFKQLGVDDPGLKPLARNGGPNQTRALTPSSPAVDITTCPAGTLDQRGVPRFSSAMACDAGAYERRMIAQPDFYSVASQENASLHVLNNDTGYEAGDPDGAFIGGSFTIVTAPTHGTAVREGDSISYEAAFGYMGEDSFVYEVCVGGACSTALVRITIGELAMSQFEPLPPQRILDTRTGAKPKPGAATTLQVLGAGGVPAQDVTAVVLNVTATEADAPGYVKVFPSGQAEPTVSNLNLEFAGQTIPNLVTVAVGLNGSVDLVTQSGAHLVADVAGYYRPATTNTSGRFQAVAPARLLDTRTDGTALPADGTRALRVTDVGGVPTDASAVVLNVTATNALAAGFITVWPAGSSRPLVSNLNVVGPGQTIPNLVIVPVGADGKVSLYSQSGTDLVVDVTGWFTGANAQADLTGLFVPLSPRRIIDTRSTTAVAAGGSISVPVGIPDVPMSAVALNVTATESLAPGFVTVWPTGGTRPLASNLNLERAGQTIPNAAIIGVGNLDSIDLFSQSGTHLVVDLAGYYVAKAPL